MTFWWCLHYYFVISLTFKIVWTVPPDYCFASFNASDCHLPPKPVFYYYKPGSRCAIQMWRGCPNLNMFESEYLCSLSCIFRMNTVTPEPTEENVTETTKSFKTKLEEMDDRQLQEISSMLNQIIKNINPVTTTTTTEITASTTTTTEITASATTEQSTDTTEIITTTDEDYGQEEPKTITAG
ncbi:hypothetical protein B5X24_HaOG212486 [Helicoverpa armigera]|nr:hypothetical protein B5X24_HaOG212486 [Helicoverpa armigera]